MEEEIIMEEEKVEENLPDKPKMEELTIEDIPGVGPSTAEKLRAAAYNNLLSIAVASPGEITETSGVTESVARKMIQFARDKLEMGFESGEDIMKRRALVKKLSTGSAAFDKLLGGGVETACVTECYGEFGSGKTQVAHLMAVLAQKQFPGCTVIYIDTENTFRPERIKQFAVGAGVDDTEVLKNIKVARAFNSDHQMLLSEKAEELITRDNLDVKLIVVDSLTAHFRAEFIGRGTLAERQQKLNRHMHQLMKLASVHNIAVYVTNQVMSKPDTFFGDPTQSIGGHIVGHNSTFRIYLRKGKKGSRVAKLVDSPNLPEGECNFMVTESGLQDL